MNFLNIPFSNHPLPSALKSLPLVTIVLLLSGCIDNDDGASGAAPEQPYTALFSPLPDTPHYPDNNRYNPAKEALGEMLFWDPVLSGERDVACASCHHPDFGWADGRATSVGVMGDGLGPERSGDNLTPVNSPTIMNVAFTGMPMQAVDVSWQPGPYFWDLRTETLEQQASGPIHNPVEMRGEHFSEQQIMPEILQRLAAIPEYVDLFASAFEDVEISETNLVAAIATFERRVISANTRFDAFLKGDEQALTAQEVTGLNKFINAGCARCHGGPMLADNTIHGDEPVIRDKQAVRTPSLRNISKTAPYMHDGSRATLRDAIAIYEERGDLQVTLEDEDFADIERFLRTLDDDSVYAEVPARVPSGLPVGGNIQ